MFFRGGLNGRSIQQGTYLGRYLSYTCLPQETQGFKTQYFKGLAKQTPSGILRLTEQVAEQIFNLQQSI